MGRIDLWLVVALAAIGFSAAQADTLYKWVDKNGNVSYHDQPPPDSAGYRVEEKVMGEAKKPREDEALAKIVEKYPVVLYYVQACGPCDLARLYLQKRKVPFTETNLDNNMELQQQLKKKFGALSAPTILIGEKVMKGYVESLLEGELDDAGYPKMETPDASAGASPEKENPPPPIESGYRPTRRY